MKYNIQTLQNILSVSDFELCKKLRVSQCVLTKMKLNNKREDFLKVKTLLVYERADVIKYLK